MDPNQNFAPAPDSPAGLPPQVETPPFQGMPAPASPAGPTQELSQEEMRANLSDMMSKIDNKYQDFNSQKFMADNESKSNQGTLLQQIFDFFQSVGVDPSKPEEVQAFLDKLKQENPEMSQQLETLLQRALGEDQAPEEEDSEDNMNINNGDTTTQQNP